MQVIILYMHTQTCCYVCFCNKLKIIDIMSVIIICSVHFAWWLHWGISLWNDPSFHQICNKAITASEIRLVNI